MGILDRLFGRSSSDPSRAEAAADVAEGPDRFFYVREWACAPETTPAEVMHALGLVDPADVSFVEGIAATGMRGRAGDAVFVVAHGGASFVFAAGVGFGDLHERLSRATGRSAYAIFLDDKRMNYLCTRAVAGESVREIAANPDEPLSDEGEPVAGEPTLGERIDEEWVLAIAARWGPDPRELVVAAPRGLLARPSP